jgi:glycosyltransferase involved in cell wall biosynthesis
MKVYDRMFDGLMRRGLKKASAIIVDSDQTRRDVTEVLEYPIDRMHVVYIGVDQEVFRPLTVTDEFLCRYNLQRDVPYILYVGSEDPRKNIRRLIEAFARIADRWQEARLLKVGAARFTAEREQLLHHIERLGLTERVHFFDQVPDADLAYFYNIAHVFIFPSLYEGFGLPALEAMACGTPVVASSTSSLPEVVGDAALLVDPYDVADISSAMEKLLLDDGTLRQVLRQRGLDRAAQFTWSRTANQILQVYQHVLERPSAS